MTIRRSFSNKIRFVLDECIPPVVRDTRWFMYPIFYIFFRGHIPVGYMDFKTLSLTMSDEEIAKYYADIGYYGKGRVTDTSEKNIEYIFKTLAGVGLSKSALLDVGCGGGDFLRRAEEQGYSVTGCDIMEATGQEGFAYKKCQAEKLAFPDQSFAVVTCLHTLEHVRDIQAAAAELKRVAQKLVVVVVPCQRYYRYTVDLHLHFFPSAASLINLMGLKEYSCINIDGDLVYVGRIASE
jgi:SAM-dependent methyltransferase